MLDTIFRAGAAAVALALFSTAGVAARSPSADPADVAAVARPSDAAWQFAGRLRATQDAAGRPYAIVDKQAAALVVFRADGSVAGTSTVLLGRDIGDLTMPGVGDRAQTGRLLPGDSTTPAGRFDSFPGRNADGDAIVWVDFDAAFAIHRLRPGASEPARARRLATVTPIDNRASAGCVVVPVAFFDSVVMPLLGRSPGVVYVMTERGGWQPPGPSPDDS